MKLLYYIRLIFFFVVVMEIIGCNTDSKNKLFKKLSANKTGISFENKLNYNDSLTILDFEYMFNGAGVALCDINKDGLTDILFTGNMVSARLYLNKGKMQFEDITEKAGLKTSGWCYGASVVDINQDGYPDIYICKAGNRKTPADSMHNLFFINNGLSPSPKGEGRGEVTFTESAKKMGLDDDGYDIQSTFLDYDHDGDLDMYLLRNSFVNYNRNTVRVKELEGGATSTDKLYRNNGDGTFANVSKEAGITIEGFGLGVTVCDINNDNWPDIYVSNDFLTNNLLWINNKNGTFTNMADKMLMHTTYNAMGNDVADYNNDGKEDIAEVDMLPPDDKRKKLTTMGNTYDQFQQSLRYGYQPQYVRNSLQLNNGNGTFSEIGQLAGVSATEWSWAPLFADFDNDGWKDLFVTNGYRQDVTNLDFIIYGKRALFMGTPEANRKDRIDKLQKFPGIKVPNYLFKNNGDLPAGQAGLTFKNMALDWGLEDATYANGAAYGDLDNDGDLDLVINNLDEPASVYQNQSNIINPEAKWLTINFKGPAGNIEGLGTKVYTWQSGQMQYQYFSPVRGYLSSVEPYLHFGFQNKPIDSLKVIWPDGKEQMLKNITANKLLTLAYTDAYIANSNFSIQASSLLFTECSNELQVHYKHQEDEFVDFKLQPLLPHMIGHEGPGISVGDVNGDGLDDFFTGAAAGSKGSFFIQQKGVGFIQRILADSNLADNMGSLLFDADNDGDNDLYLVNGGVCDKKNGDSVYKHLLYVNNGKGNFTIAKNAIPPINTSGSSVVGADYDHDGDIDLFVGGRLSPGDYPMAPESFLLRNDLKNGFSPSPLGESLSRQVGSRGEVIFTNITKQSGLNPATLGMVTSALFTDFDNDGWQDLLVVGEFMPIRFFKNMQGNFKEVTSQTGLTNTGGWWNSLSAGDFDNDGDIDYIAGNLGLNGPYRVSAEEPVCIYAKDYDKNGRLDPVMCHYENGKEYLVHARDDINKQITPMRGRFRDYTSYAAVTFKEAFTQEEIKDAYVVKAQTFASSYIENKGNDKFVIHQLPLQAQFAPIYGMICKDFNADGNLDVLCVGNSYATEVQTGRYDAQGSVLLMGNGKGNFIADRKPINAMRDNKSLAELIHSDGTSLYVVGSNSDSLQVYRLNEAKQKSVAINRDDAYAIVTAKNGKQYRQEFYYGSSYLSQSARHLTIAPNIQSVIIFNNQGNKRQLTF